jgi:hypothetical protein
MGKMNFGGIRLVPASDERTPSSDWSHSPGNVVEVQENEELPSSSAYGHVPRLIDWKESDRR